MLVRKIVAHKAEFLGEVNQALKHQFTQNVSNPYFGVVARGQCLFSESFTKFWGQLAMMFSSRGKHTKAVHATSTAVDNEDIGVDTEQHLSHNSHKRQNKINAQATEIAAVKVELNKELQENKKLKYLFNPDKMVEAMTKVVAHNDSEGAPKNILGHSV